MRYLKPIHLFLSVISLCWSPNSFCQDADTVSPLHQVTLKQAHVGSLAIDTMLLNSYSVTPLNIQQFYLKARAVFENNRADFTNKQITAAALKNEINLMGGPMLGDVKANGISLWLRPSNKTPIQIKVTASDNTQEKIYTIKPVVPGKEQRTELNDLSPSTGYKYVVTSKNKHLAEGTFKTAPEADNTKQLRLTFGSCFHKIGLHNTNLVNAILDRNPQAMLLLGDIAVDDRENNFSMHRADYLLRDVSPAWKKLASNVPLYTSWDDHDYLNNDLSGVPGRFSKSDREELRSLWHRNWNNPPNNVEGIYFNTRIGQVEVIMLDTRSCRKVDERGEYGSYLGTEQLKWLKDILKSSTAPFKIISSGTMWSDYITNGKDSWGTWDTVAREEIFNFIEKENISGILLISGDRHGARGFTIPRESGFNLYEFEAASLGGVPGPDAMAKDTENQLFGYDGEGLKAFGEFTFFVENSEPLVTFRLIDEFGNIMEEHRLSLSQLTPQK